MDNAAADLSRGLPAISRNLHLRSTLGKERASCRWHISSPGSRAQDAALWSGLGQDRQVRLPQICNPSGINWSQGEGEHLEPLIFWPAASNPATLYQPVDRTTFSAGYNFFNGCRSTLIAASLLDARGHFFRPAVKDSGICDIFCIGRFFLDIFWGVFCSRFSTTLLSRTKCGSVGLIPRSGHCPAAPMSKAGQGLKEAAWPNPDLVDKRSVAVTSRREIWNVVSSLLW